MSVSHLIYPMFCCGAFQFHTCILQHPEDGTVATETAGFPNVLDGIAAFVHVYHQFLSFHPSVCGLRKHLYPFRPSPRTGCHFAHGVRLFGQPGNHFQQVRCLGFREQFIARIDAVMQGNKPHRFYPAKLQKE